MRFSFTTPLFLFGLVSAASVPTKRACDETCRLAGAKAYVKATVSHKASDIAKVPLAEDVDRFETFNGKGPLNTGNSSEEIRKALKTGPQVYTTYGVKDDEYHLAENQTAIANYVLKAGLLGGLLPITTARVRELFETNESGDITHIEAFVFIGSD